VYGEIAVPVSVTNRLIKLKVKSLMPLRGAAAQIVTANMMNEGKAKEIQTEIVLLQQNNNENIR
jgi:hypothetical protein